MMNCSNSVQNKFGELSNPVRYMPRYREVTRQAIKDHRHMVNHLFCAGTNYYQDHIKNAISSVRTRVFTQAEVEKIAGLNTNINHNDNATQMYSEFKDRFGDFFPGGVEAQWHGSKMASDTSKMMAVGGRRKGGGQNINNNDSPKQLTACGRKSRVQPMTGTPPPSSGSCQQHGGTGSRSPSHKVCSCFNTSIRGGASEWPSLCSPPASSPGLSRTYYSKLRRTQLQLYCSSRQRNITSNNAENTNNQPQLQLKQYLDPLIVGENKSHSAKRANGKPGCRRRQCLLNESSDDTGNVAGPSANCESRSTESRETRPRRIDSAYESVQISARAGAKLGVYNRVKAYGELVSKLVIKSNKRFEDDLTVIPEVDSNQSVSRSRDKRKAGKERICMDMGRKMRVLQKKGHHQDRLQSRRPKFGDVLNRVKAISRSLAPSVTADHIQLVAGDNSSHKNYKISTYKARGSTLDDIINSSTFLHHTLLEFKPQQMRYARCCEEKDHMLRPGAACEAQVFSVEQRPKCAVSVQPVCAPRCCCLLSPVTHTDPSQYPHTASLTVQTLEACMGQLPPLSLCSYQNHNTAPADNALQHHCISPNTHLSPTTITATFTEPISLHNPCPLCWNYFPTDEDSWDEISATGPSTSSDATQATKDYGGIRSLDSGAATSDENCGSDLDDEELDDEALRQLESPVVHDGESLFYRDEEHPLKKQPMCQLLKSGQGLFDHRDEMVQRQQQRHKTGAVSAAAHLFRPPPHEGVVCWDSSELAELQEVGLARDIEPVATTAMLEPDRLMQAESGLSVSCVWSVLDEYEASVGVLAVSRLPRVLEGRAAFGAVERCGLVSLAPSSAPGSSIFSSARPLVVGAGPPLKDAREVTLLERHNSCIDDDDTQIHTQDATYSVMHSGSQLWYCQAHHSCASFHQLSERLVRPTSFYDHNCRTRAAQRPEKIVLECPSFHVIDKQAQELSRRESSCSFQWDLINGGDCSVVNSSNSSNIRLTPELSILTAYFSDSSDISQNTVIDNIMMGSPSPPHTNIKLPPTPHDIPNSPSPSFDNDYFIPPLDSNCCCFSPPQTNTQLSPQNIANSPSPSNNDNNFLSPFCNNCRCFSPPQSNQPHSPHDIANCPPTHCINNVLNSNCHCFSQPQSSSLCHHHLNSNSPQCSSIPDCPLPSLPPPPPPRHTYSNPGYPVKSDTLLPPFSPHSNTDTYLSPSNQALYLSPRHTTYEILMPLEEERSPYSI